MSVDESQVRSTLCAMVALLLVGCVTIPNPRAMGMEGVMMLVGHTLTGTVILIQSNYRGDRRLPRGAEYKQVHEVSDEAGRLHVRFLVPELDELEWPWPVAEQAPTTLSFEQAGRRMVELALLERARFGSERNVNLEVRLIPDGYRYYSRTRVSVDDDPLTLAVAARFGNLDSQLENAPSHLALALSVVFHELVHIYARGETLIIYADGEDEIGPLRSLTEEEFYALTSDRCLRLDIDGHLNHFLPQIRNLPGEDELRLQMDAFLDQVESVEDLYGVAVGDVDFTRGLTATTFMFEWAERYLSEPLDRADRHHASPAHLWCALVRDDPRAVLDGWPGEMPRLVEELLDRS